jgi:peptidyl-tRNA hydrolase, PTH1 family
MKIIACLGNPGKKYSRNRHNAGYIFGSYIADKSDISVKKKVYSSLAGRGSIFGSECLIIFPQTFMNRSGEAVRESLGRCGESAENLIVIHDEIELAFGDIRTKFGGGHKGHNGLRSIFDCIGTADFHRVRIGVGRPADSDTAVADYLLSNFSAEEMEKINELLPVGLEKIRALIEKPAD